MLDNFRPEIRAAVWVALVILAGLVAAALVVLGVELFGFATVGLIMAVAVLGYFIYIAYTIALSQEQYRDSVKNLQNTVKE